MKDGTAVLQTVIALGTSIKDIVNAAITTNKLADGAVVADKIAANTITADKMYVQMLSAWHLIHTDTDATGTDFTIYKPDGTVAGSGTVAGTSQAMSLYGKSDELVISNNITPTLAQETATSQVQWHKSGLPYDDELFIFNAKPNNGNIKRTYNNIRRNASFTLGTYPDGKKIRIANTHATNTITCTLPSGQTMNGAGTISIPAGRIIDIELIGTTWLHISDFTEAPPTPWAQYSGKDIPQLPDNVQVLRKK